MSKKAKKQDLFIQRPFQNRLISFKCKFNDFALKNSSIPHLSDAGKWMKSPETKSRENHCANARQNRMRAPSGGTFLPALQRQNGNKHNQDNHLPKIGLHHRGYTFLVISSLVLVFFSRDILELQLISSQPYDIFNYNHSSSM